MENYYNLISATGLNEVESYIINNYNNITCLGSINVSSNSTFLSNLNVVGDINTSGLSVSNTNSNINLLSTQLYLDILNIKTTSTTIFNNLNLLSSQSYFLTNYTNLNSLNVSSTTKLNGATSDVCAQ